MRAECSSSNSSIIFLAYFASRSALFCTFWKICRAVKPPGPRNSSGSSDDEELEPKDRRTFLQLLLSEHAHARHTEVHVISRLPMVATMRRVNMLAVVILMTAIVPPGGTGGSGYEPLGLQPPIHSVSRWRAEESSVLAVAFWGLASIEILYQRILHHA